MTNQQIEKKVASLLRKAEKEIGIDNNNFRCYLDLAREYGFMKTYDEREGSVFKHSAFTPEPEELAALLGDNNDAS